VRTANASARATPAAAVPPATAPPGTVQPPLNRIPASSPATGQSGYVLPGSSPATRRMRGFESAAGESRPGASGVAPASYAQPVPTFSEATPADGQWRAR
jgi:hypothetical protein